MIYILLNLAPIAAATLLGLAIGFGYHRAIGNPRSMSTGLVVLAALGEFWLAAILAGALILAPDKADPWIMATGSAIVIWAGFVLPLLAITQVYRSAPRASVIGDSLHWLVVMLVQAVAMKLIGLVPPPV
ncbi:MAG: hypothetical protein B7Y45_08470 [Sphingomonas sp. 28-66-16]|nr:MAG: hypothetical protein B7Y45_08470 [Sphingomonas sp. 28-66-16]